MTEERPRYGEYATPEQQRAAAGLSPLPPEPAPAPPGDARSPQAVNPADRLVTFALLALGLVNVLTSFGGFVDLSATLNRTLETVGVDGEFTNHDAARTWGVIAAVVMLVGYALTALLAFRRLRAGRVTFWIPLVGLVATMAVVSACIAVPMFGDPAFTRALIDSAGV